MPSLLHAQGILPSSSEVHISTAGSHIPVLIGEKVPENLIVQDSHGTKRTLLSYKAAIEILVVEFLSSRCAADQALEPELQRFYESYKGWHAAFVAVDMGGVDGPRAIPVVRDPSGTLQHTLKVTETPEILLMDEDGFLRYRGPPGRELRSAIDAVIGHTEPVPKPEPAVTTGCPVQ